MSVYCCHRDARRHRAHSALRLAPGVSVLVAVAAWVVGCGDSQPPVAVGTIPELTVYANSIESVDLAGYFSDPDGDELSYEAWSSNAEVATVAISGDSVAVSGVAGGSAEITVTASDGSHMAAQDFAAFVPLTDLEVLEMLYDELGGDSWRYNWNWKTDMPLEEWYGVSANANGRVDTLRLGSNQLAGEIPPELGSLSDIEVLSLDSNSLTGTIPPELGNLSNLERLYLGSNSLTGEIPPELGNLSSLVWLDLYDNSLTGEIPSELGDLPSLFLLWLDLGLNELSGEIPSELGRLGSLGYLFLEGNSLTGEVPPELGDLSNLVFLYLNANSLTGEIPPELGDLENLYYLLLNHNSLTGDIPSEFLALSSLEFFYWNANNGLCAPNTDEFDDWLDGLRTWGGPRCRSRSGDTHRDRVPVHLGPKNTEGGSSVR